MNNDNPDLFSKDLMNKIFDQEWYDTVMEATVLACDNADKIGMKREDIIDQVINYNINKRIEDVILNSLIEGLPKSLDWKNIDVIEAFEDFKNIVDSCDICPSFVDYSVKIQLNKSNRIKQELFEWKELVNNNYPALKLIIKELRGHQILLQINRVLI